MATISEGLRVKSGRVGGVVVCPASEGTIVGADVGVVVASRSGAVVGTTAGSGDGNSVGTRYAGPGSVLRDGP